jgi:uncharacterized linocin/CFP29 family protein
VTTDHLRRELAPISDEAWGQIEEEARRTLRSYLAARPLIDVTGPLGWRHSAHGLGRVAPVAAGPVEGVVAELRQVQPLVELRTPFEVPFSALDAADRGAPDADWDSVIEAARRAALAEDTALFHGYPAAGIAGIVGGSVHDSLPIAQSYDDYPSVVARAVAQLRTAGVDGPYALALGPRCYTGVVETTEQGGYPVFEHLKMILGGPVLWAPGVDGAVVVSQRGGDLELVLGQDLSIGYRSHTADAVQLYLEESLTLVVLDGRAAIGLAYPE